jgi:hypothetical protein
LRSSTAAPGATRHETAGDGRQKRVVHSGRRKQGRRIGLNHHKALARREHQHKAAPIPRSKGRVSPPCGTQHVRIQRQQTAGRPHHLGNRVSVAVEHDDVPQQCAAGLGQRRRSLRTSVRRGESRADGGIAVQCRAEIGGHFFHAVCGNAGRLRNRMFAVALHLDHGRRGETAADEDDRDDHHGADIPTRATQPVQEHRSSGGTGGRLRLRHVKASGDSQFTIMDLADSLSISAQGPGRAGDFGLPRAARNCNHMGGFSAEAFP